MPGERYPPESIVRGELGPVVHGAKKAANTVLEHAARAVVGMTRSISSTGYPRVHPEPQEQQKAPSNSMNAVPNGNIKGAGDRNQRKQRISRKQRKQRISKKQRKSRKQRISRKQRNSRKQRKIKKGGVRFFPPLNLFRLSRRRVLPKDTSLENEDTPLDTPLDTSLETEDTPLVPFVPEDNSLVTDDRPSLIKVLNSINNDPGTMPLKEAIIIRLKQLNQLKTINNTAQAIKVEEHIKALLEILKAINGIGINKIIDDSPQIVEIDSEQPEDAEEAEEAEEAKEAKENKVSKKPRVRKPRDRTRIDAALAVIDETNNAIMDAAQTARAARLQALKDKALRERAFRERAFRERNEDEDIEEISTTGGKQSKSRKSRKQRKQRKQRISKKQRKSRKQRISRKQRNSRKQRKIKY